MVHGTPQTLNNTHHSDIKFSYLIVEDDMSSSCNAFMQIKMQTNFSALIWH